MGGRERSRSDNLFIALSHWRPESCSSASRSPQVPCVQESGRTKRSLEMEGRRAGSPHQLSHPPPSTVTGEESKREGQPVSLGVEKNPKPVAQGLIPQPSPPVT